jgi:hypothetical protein
MRTRGAFVDSALLLLLLADAAGRALVSNKLHSLCTALKKVSPEPEAACMERNLLRKQVRDERDRGHTLPSEVVCLVDRLKSARRKTVRLEEANEKLVAKQQLRCLGTTTTASCAIARGNLGVQLCCVTGL